MSHNSASTFQAKNDEPGGKEYQGSQKNREQTTVSQKTVKEESTRTEHHHSSFQSARSVFERRLVFSLAKQKQHHLQGQIPSLLSYKAFIL